MADGTVPTGKHATSSMNFVFLCRNRRCLSGGEKLKTLFLANMRKVTAKRGPSLCWILLPTRSFCILYTFIALKCSLGRPLEVAHSKIARETIETKYAKTGRRRSILRRHGVLTLEFLFRKRTANCVAVKVD